MEYDWIPMTDELKAALLQWWEDRPLKAANVFVCLDSSPFCEQYKGQPFEKRLQFMRRLCDRAGVKRFGFHAIRHLSAVALYRAGCPTAVIQQILRHQRATTTDAYLKSLGLLLDPSREALEEGLSALKGRVIELKNKRPRTGTSEAF
jgi:integrase